MQKWKILLADDDPEDREIIRDAVEMLNENESICFVDNGEQVLDVLNGNYNQVRPSVIVLDLNMPKMGGTQTLRKLKDDERFRQIPIIIYSTSINNVERDKCMALGAHSYITKPLTVAESLETARLLLQFC